MTPDRIDLTDWIRFGEGNNGQSYYHRTDNSLMLKLNDTSWTQEMTLNEFMLSRAVHDLGVRCPEALRFVTDGVRFGYTSRRIREKRSYARMIADEPGRIPELAARFAARARELHSIGCDTSRFGSALECRAEKIRRNDALPDDVRSRLLAIAADFNQDACACLHGDFHPGNLIEGLDGDYWIDLGSFSYGDPLLDIASMYDIGHFVPEKALREIFHVGRRTFLRFLDEFLRCYYGEALDAGLMDRIRNAALFKAGVSMCEKPGSAFIFIPLIRGQRFRFAAISAIVSLLWPVLRRKRR